MRQRRFGSGQSSTLRRSLFGCIIGAAAIFPVGCASPGQPRPPSLHLPELVTDLSAGRTGSHVALHWTTPSSTTDQIPAPLNMTAVLCRQAASPKAGHPACTEFARLPVHPGPSSAQDDLPVPLASGPATLLSYRVEILNPQGRSAGRSQEAFAAAGSTPPRVNGLAAIPIRRGVHLQWSAGQSSAAVVLDRLNLSEPPPSPEAKPRKAVLGTPGKPPAEVHLSASELGHADPGGALDGTAQKGSTYSYTAQRRGNVTLEGHTLELRSDVSAPVTVKVLQTFPPSPPSALEAAPGSAESPSIDLSWRPGTEPDLAGYNIYRAEVTAGTPPASWQKLNPRPVPVPAFEDTTTRSGTRYLYRVTAVDADGNESAPGNEVRESPGTR